MLVTVKPTESRCFFPVLIPPGCEASGNEFWGQRNAALNGDAVPPLLVGFRNSVVRHLPLVSNEPWHPRQRIVDKRASPPGQ